MQIKNFADIESWKEAREFVKIIYDVTLNSQLSRDYGLKDQIRRASVSIMSNIAEGFDSGSDKSFINFLRISYRSASEVESLLIVLLDLHYIDKAEYEVINERIVRIKKFIGGFIKYLKSTLTN